MSQPEKTAVQPGADDHNCCRRHSGIFAGILLVALGLILLLNIMGVLHFSMWHAVAVYWPVGLILIGVAVMLRLRWLTVALILITVVLCTLYLADSYDSHFIRESGIIMNRTSNVGNFDGIRLRVPAEVYISQSLEGQGPRVMLVGDANLLNKTQVSLQDNNVVIEYPDEFLFWHFWDKDKLKVYVSSPNIRSIQIDGAGDIIGKTPITTDNLEIMINGAGDVDLNVTADTLKTQISGFGDLELEGTVREHQAVISGAGEIDAYDLSTQDTKLEMSGSGDAQVSASKSLDVTISGAGDVSYRGDAQVTQHISGAGDVSKDD